MTTPPEHVSPVNPLFIRNTPIYQVAPHLNRYYTAQPAPHTVTFPFGHATFPTIPAQVLPFVKEVIALLTSLTPVFSEQEQPQEGALLPQKTYEALKNALETLRNQLQPVKSQPFVAAEGIPKEFVPFLIKIPALLALIQVVLKEPEKQQKEQAPRLLITPEKLQAMTEIGKAIPVFTGGLKELVIRLPQVPVLAKEAVLQYIKEPVLQMFAPTSLPKELPLVAQEGMQRVPNFVQKQTMPPVVEQPLTEKAPLLQTERQPEVVVLTYPYYVPKLRQKPQVQERLPPMYTVQLPIFTGFPLIHGFGNQGLERREPEFSTEIPFAFIVPYVATNPVHTNPEQAGVAPQDPKKEIEVNDEEGGDEKGEKVHIFAYIPRGDSQYGDPFAEGDRAEQPLRNLIVNSFAIGVYLVTNQQFADYLTRESKKKNIELKERGEIYQEGRLLCQTKMGSSFSDIEPDKRKDYIAFKAVQGKEAYPVVCVTYFGAKAFCKEAGFRLPTEMEWEKAAGVKMTEKNKVAHKFRFGCGRDDISFSCANYGKSTYKSLESGTSPVGFYNGTTVFIQDGVSLQSINAESPFGCYDMSGNVWEWTDTNIGEEKAIKGGCFQSHPYELRVSARKAKNPETLDGMTGFRVALS